MSKYGQAIHKRIVKGKEVHENMFEFISNWKKFQHQMIIFVHCLENIKRYPVLERLLKNSKMYYEDLLWFNFTKTHQL